MIRQAMLCALCVCFFMSACTRSLSPQEQAQVQALRAELEATKKEVSAAEVQNSQYSEGLVKALTVLRLEVLKTNVTLIQQRIHAIESGAKISIETVATQTDPERAKLLEEELSRQELKVSEAETKASLYSGGLVGAMAVMGAATERNSLALLRQQYLIAKYGLASPQQVASVPKVSARMADAPSAREASVVNADQELREQILDATILRKQYAKQDYQDYIFFDIAGLHPLS